jgi:hypothetical protein
MGTTVRSFKAAVLARVSGLSAHPGRYQEHALAMSREWLAGRDWVARPRYHSNYEAGITAASHCKQPRPGRAYTLAQ